MSTPMTPLARTAAAALVVMTFGAAACEREADQRTGTVTDRDVRAAREAVDPGAVAALDSGNAAYRARDYEGALRYYQVAADRQDALPAAWFGIYMAQLALGNTEAAEAAMAQARRRAPSASLIQPDPAEPVPADHPAVRPRQ